MADQRARLKNDHAEAGSAFDPLRAQLRDRIGVSPQEEYQRLSRAAGEAWNALQLTRQQLDRHIRDTGDTVFYEIFPDLTWQPADLPLTWFEIALHAETEEYQPPANPRSREVFSVLMDLADFLIQQIQPQAPYEVDLSVSYYTLHPSACGDFCRTRLSRSVSLVFFNVAPYRKGEAPLLLTEITNHLSLLGISRLKVDRLNLTDTGVT